MTPVSIKYLPNRLTDLLTDSRDESQRTFFLGLLVILIRRRLCIARRLRILLSRRTARGGKDQHERQSAVRGRIRVHNYLVFLKFLGTASGILTPAKPSRDGRMPGGFVQRACHFQQKRAGPEVIPALLNENMSAQPYARRSSMSFSSHVHMLEREFVTRSFASDSSAVVSLCPAAGTLRANM